ncbi:hypothetical protein [Microbispora sp. NPDC049125]|uniref:hypothetical protein n=1 Tax=Microbispora sp. NPDC049125 TaxID=3154929 RepID=UPI0034650651
MNDFDFFIGEWNVVNRRLVKRGVGSTEWDEFPGRSVAHGMFGGAGHFDEITFPTKDFDGATVRVYNRERDEWSIHWINSKLGLDPVPVVGRFVDGVGTFFSDDTDDGRPIRVRFTWTHAPGSCRWAQAFSYDGEQSWETNWIMEFTRAA